MSWRYVLTINRMVLMKEQPAQQVSPLRFATPDEATDFGQKMFEPPQSVESWDLEETKESPNFSYKNGTLKAL